MLLSFRIELHGGGGELHVTMPYSMLEPLRELLEPVSRADAAPRSDERWSSALRDEIEDAEIELKPCSANAALTLAELLNLKSGDVIPCDFNGSITLKRGGGAPVPRQLRRLPRPTGREDQRTPASRQTRGRGQSLPEEA